MADKWIGIHPSVDQELQEIAERVCATYSNLPFPKRKVMILAALRQAYLIGDSDGWWVQQENDGDKK